VLWLSEPCESPDVYKGTLRAYAAELELPVDRGAMDGARYFYPRPANGLTAWGEGRRLEPLPAARRVAEVRLTPLVTGQEPADWPPPAERIRRAKAYLAKLPPAIEGKHGDAATVRAIRIPWDFGIPIERAMDVLSAWNSRCEPPWEADELEGKVSRLYRGKGPFGAKLRGEPRGTVVLGVFGDAGAES